MRDYFGQEFRTLAVIKLNIKPCQIGVCGVVCVSLGVLGVKKVWEPLGFINSC